MANTVRIKSRGTARTKKTGEKISKGLVRFYLKAGAPSISELREKEQEKQEKERKKVKRGK